MEGKRPRMIVSRGLPRWQLWFFCLYALTILLWIGAAWVATRMIASPARRDLQDYHLQILQNPTAHGIQVSAFDLPDGTPVLLCRPDPAATLGPRGTLLRQQLICPRWLRHPRQCAHHPPTTLRRHGGMVPYPPQSKADAG